MRKRKRVLGLSLAELMVALGVIAIGMAGVAASLFFGFKKSGHGEHLAVATNQARVIIETIQGQSMIGLAVPKDGNQLPDDTTGLNDPPGADPVPLDAPPFPQNTFTLPEREIGMYQRTINMERLGAAGTIEDTLVRVTVTIYWQQEGVVHSAPVTAILEAPPRV
jgi:type II secretory pathway pseudopilin PulG